MGRGRRAAGMGVALVRSPAEALADESFLADGCVVEVDDPERRPHPPRRPRARVLGATPGRRARSGAASAATHTDDVRRRSRGHSGAARTRPARRATSASHRRSRASGCSTSASASPARSPAGCSPTSGADVIKVHALHDSYWAGTHMGLGTNRGKRSIALNLKDPRGREVLDRLIERADVLTTNWRPGAAARLGIDYETLRAPLPRLVYCNTRGYEKGPRSDLPGTDQTAAALDRHRVGGRRLRRRQPAAVEPVEHGRHRQRAARRDRDHGRAVPPRAHRRGPGGRAPRS